MNQQELNEKARAYIANEEHSFFREQVETLLEENNTDELNDRFYTNLAFGTGGLRGVIGGGLNRMNPYTVKRATQGLANYINEAVGKGNGSAVIAYDSRNFSDLFALEAAKVLCGNGIKTALFTSLRPTPELSFAVRHLKATAGIVVTASHNPPEYNGYKVYWDDGAQIVAPHDKAIIEEVLSVTEKATEISEDEALSSGMLRMIDSEVDDAFIAMVKNCAVEPSLLKEYGKDFKVVFTPLHGSGAMPVERALKEMGVDVIFVEEQKAPDGNFPTVSYPNPEEASAMKMALELGQRVNADLIIGTDPDADRLGIAAKNGDTYELISGNRLGSLLADYILSSREKTNTMPEKPAIIKTIVTTELQRLIASAYAAECIDTLTGFKFIGEKIHEFETTTDGFNYVFGGEESYGYLVNTEVRDKDAVSAATMTVEMALHHRLQGRTLFDQLAKIWEQHGYFEEVLITKTFKGQEGVATIKRIMEGFRTAPPQEFAGITISTVKDYATGSTRNCSENTETKDIALPSSNVVQFILTDDTIITARPSGTEPKVKFYISCRGVPGGSLETSREEVRRKTAAISDALNTLLTGE